MRKLEGFADFPIDTGGEWIQTEDRRILQRIVDQESDRLNQLQVIRYRPNYVIYNGGYAYDDRYFQDAPYFRFVNYTWFDFFDELIAPLSRDRVIFRCVVNAIDFMFTNVPVSVTCIDGRTFYADYVIVAVPVSILQSPSQISFIPSLPFDKMNALQQVQMPPGAKLFLKFRDRFYDEAFQLDSDTTGSDHELFFYDVALGEKSDDNVLGAIFIGNDRARRFAGQSKATVTNSVLQDLDQIYGGRASVSFVESFYQDWSVEPYIQGSYSSYDESRDFQRTIQSLVEPYDRIFFAGEYLPANGWEYGYVHGAALSGRAAATSVMRENSMATSNTFSLFIYVVVVNVISFLCCVAWT